MGNDDRFKDVKKDPKFKRVHKRQKNVELDQRFISMFTSDEFKSKTNVDKFGRPFGSSSTVDLKEYYRLTNDDVRAKLKDLTVDYARGEQNLLSESSSDDSGPTDLESDCESDAADDWNVFGTEADSTETATHRLALCNMDWDNIRAADIMMLFNSFKNSNGCINSVKIYQSKFGAERMMLEEKNGPTELVKDGDDDDEEQDNESDDEYNSEQLRKYELNKLKYYYAIIDCDNAQTANAIYVQCDGREYESSGITIDLRFVDDDEVFDQEPKEVCEDVPDLTKYKPRNFANSALKQVSVKLTWDETDPHRKDFMSKTKYDEFDENDLKTYLASPSDTDDDDDDDADGDKVSVSGDGIEKYKQLLKEIEEQQQNRDDFDEGDDDIGFEDNITTKSSKKKMRKNEVSDKSVDNEESKDQLELLMMNDEPVDDKKKHYSLQKLLIDDNGKVKRKRKFKSGAKGLSEDTFKVNVNEERFSAVFSDPLYAIDPSDPSFKKTKGMDQFLDEKIKRMKH